MGSSSEPVTHDERSLTGTAAPSGGTSLAGLVVLTTARTAAVQFGVSLAGVAASSYAAARSAQAAADATNNTNQFILSAGRGIQDMVDRLQEQKSAVVTDVNQQASGHNWDARQARMELTSPNV